MIRLLKFAGCLVVASTLATLGCGGGEDLPEDQAGTAGDLTPLHHMAPDDVTDFVDDKVADEHFDAIDDLLERLEDVENSMAREGDLDDGDSTTEETQEGDSPGADGDFLEQPDGTREDVNDEIDQQLDEETPDEVRDGEVDGEPNDTRTGEDDLRT